MAKKEIVVLRYGHRHVRDYRITSHCCLVARAFGANKTIIQGEKDEEIVKTIKGVVRNWGGKFKLEFVDSWQEVLSNYKKQGFKVAHATMYGEPLRKRVGELRTLKKLVLVIGSQKVERGVYEQSDYNISITSQPHSEVAALAVLLHEIFQGKELGKKFRGAKLKITPSTKGKIVSKKTLR